MKRRNQFSKGQTKLLNDSLKRLLGNGLIEDINENLRPMQSALIQDALNLTVLNSKPTQSTSTPHHSGLKSESLKHP